MSAVNQYTVTLTDENGSVPHIVDRDEVGDFINGINWANTYVFSVEPIEPLAEWELYLLNSANEESESFPPTSERPEGSRPLTVRIEIEDPEKALEALDRLTVNELGSQVPSDVIVFAWKRSLRAKIEQAILEERGVSVDSIWKTVPHFTEYEINKYGTVRSAKSGRELTKYDDSPQGLMANLWSAPHSCFVNVLIEPIVKELFDGDQDR
jgi:hypothetical protein